MILPQYKLTSASFFLKQDWDLSKPNKADLISYLTRFCQGRMIEYLPETVEKRIVIVNFDICQ